MQTNDAKQYWLNPNCFEKTKVRWGILKKLSPTRLHSEQVAPLAANYQIDENNVRQIEMKIFTEKESFRLSKSQKATLLNLQKIGFDKSKFIRKAISEKIKREYKFLIEKKSNKIKIPF